MIVSPTTAGPIIGHVRRALMPIPLSALPALPSRLALRMLYLLAALCIAWPQTFHPIHLATAHASDAHQDAGCHHQCGHEHGETLETAIAATSQVPGNTACLVTHCSLCVMYKISGGHRFEQVNGECNLMAANTGHGAPAIVQDVLSIDSLPFSGPRAPPLTFVS